MPTIPPDRVYRGYWIDYSRGNILGATITIDSTGGNIVVAIISILITIAGAYLWDTVACLAFGIHATDGPADAVHHQRQLLLRNLPSPAGILLRTIKMCWRWRRQHVQPIRRLCHLALTAALCSGGFLAAGVISSQIVSTTAIQILVKSASCGFPITSGTISLTDRFNEYWWKSISAATQYGRTCFNTTEGDPSCQVFSTQAIPFSTTYRSCPYENACMLTNTAASALQMDTGLLSSDVIFGINAKPQDRIFLRKVTTCAPLNMSRYERILNLNESDPETLRNLGRAPFPGEQIIEYYLGPQYPYNYSLSLSTVLSKFSASYGFGMIGSYMPVQEAVRLAPRSARPASYTPLNTFQNFEGDFALAIVSSDAVSYEAPCDDPVFSAHRNVQINDTNFYNASDGSPYNRTVYLSDAYAGGIGCSEQYQFCLPYGNCTRLSGLQTVILDTISFDFTPMQNVTLFAFISAIVQMRSQVTMMEEAPLALLAYDALRYNFMYLPPNQWELEVKSWMAIVLSKLMRSFAEHAAGLGAFFPGSNFDQLPMNNPGPHDHVFCHAQKLFAPDGLSNISVIGLLLVVIFCGLVIATNLCLIPLLRCISRLQKRPWRFLRDWDDEELLRYQRLAFEAGGVAGWIGESHEVPITCGQRLLPSLASLAPSSGHTTNMTMNTSGNQTTHAPMSGLGNNPRTIPRKPVPTINVNSNSQASSLGSELQTLSNPQSRVRSTTSNRQSNSNQAHSSPAISTRTSRSSSHNSRARMANSGETMVQSVLIPNVTHPRSGP